MALQSRPRFHPQVVCFKASACKSCALKAVGPQQPYQVYDENTQRLALRRQLCDDDQWVRRNMQQACRSCASVDYNCAVEHKVLQLTRWSLTTCACLCSRRLLWMSSALIPTKTQTKRELMPPNTARRLAARLLLTVLCALVMLFFFLTVWWRRKAEKSFFLETTRKDDPKNKNNSNNDAKTWLQCRTTGLATAWNRLLNFHIVRSTKAVVFTAPLTGTTTNRRGWTNILDKHCFCDTSRVLMNR